VTWITRDVGAVLYFPYQNEGPRANKHIGAQFEEERPSRTRHRLKGGRPRAATTNRAGPDLRGNHKGWTGKGAAPDRQTQPQGRPSARLFHCTSARHAASSRRRKATAAVAATATMVRDVLAEAPLCKHEPPTDGFCLVLLFSFSARLYKLRWRIEAAFNRLKDFRRVATRYDRLARNYLASVCLAAALAWWV
jgi:transposase